MQAQSDTATPARWSPRATKIALVALSVLSLVAMAALALAHSAQSAAAGRPGLPGDAPRVRATVTGQLLQLHADDFAHDRSTDWNALRTSAGDLLRVDLSHVHGAGRLANQGVRLAGERRDGVFVAADARAVSGWVATQAAKRTRVGFKAASATRFAGRTATTTTVFTHRTAVILLNFTNDTRQPWTPTEISNLMFGDSGSVNAYYEESSYGDTSFTGSVFGWVTIPYDNSGCNYWTWGSAAQQALGINPNDYNNVVYIWPQAASCYWGGAGGVLGTMAWINGYVTVQVLAHELGHNIGVQHAGSLECSENGVRVTISIPANCHRNEYGDPYSVMGNGSRQWTNWNRGQVGWLPELTTITKPGSYTVAPVEYGAQPRLLRIARNDGSGKYFYFEFRQPSGNYDDFAPTDPAVNGVLIRLAPDMGQLSQSALLDMTPDTRTLLDASLVVGQTFTDPVSGVSVTTTAVSPSGATISVSFGGGGGGGGTGQSDTTPPTVPGDPTVSTTSTSVSLTWTASTDNVGVAGYRVSRDGAVLGTTAASSYTDTGLAPGTSYLYDVTAFDAAGNESAASEVVVTTAVDTTAPKAPTKPKALVGTTQVALSWGPSTDAVGVTAYEIYRDGVMVAETPLPNWLDEDLAAGSTHKYQVLARDAAGNRSALSSALSARLVAFSTATTGTLVGVIYDRAGRPLSSTVVQLAGAGLTKTVKTSASGSYKFGALPAGPYTLLLSGPTIPTPASSEPAVAAGRTIVLVTTI